MKRYSWLCLLILFIACGSNEFMITDISNTANIHSEAPNLLSTDDGRLFLSYIEMDQESLDVLYVAEYLDGSFKNRKKVSSGSDWFVNWADFPVMAAFKNKRSYAISWLQKSAAGTYDYDIHISISTDDMQSWQPSFILHQDSIAAEHGFLSLSSEGDYISAAWLDGRNTKLPDGAYGSMTLRNALIDIHGHVLESTQLDDRVCDCCQIDMAIDGSDRYIVYGDRSMLEYRDNMLKVYQHGIWQENIPLDTVHWKIAGCPVNGPAIALDQQLIATASYTQIDDAGAVWLTTRNKTELKEIHRLLLNEGNTLGRIDILSLHDQRFFITWLEEYNEEMYVYSAIYHTADQSIKKQRLFPINSSRKSGFPRIAVHADGVMLSYTHVVNEAYQVKTVWIPIS